MKILLACGGTGGHIIPALNFLNTLGLRQDKDQVLLVLTHRKIENRILPSHYQVAYINISALGLKLNRQNCLGLLKLFRAALESLIIIIRFRPQVAVGFGGYASFFPLFFSWGLGVKTMIHEQNVNIGIANRMLAPFVDRIAVSFRQTKNHLERYRNKITVTGNPLRLELGAVDRKTGLKFFGFSQNKPTVLVMGGSLGAHKVNTQFLKAVFLLKQRLDLQIIHLCGEKDFDFLKEEYKKSARTVKLFAFLEQMHYAYAAADFAICRAGATTISEIIFCKLPAVIIPYPYGSRHQAENAKLLSEKDCAISVRDEDLRAELLSKIIIELARSPKRVELMRSNYNAVQDMNMEHSLREVFLNLSK